MARALCKREANVWLSVAVIRSGPTVKGIFGAAECFCKVLRFAENLTPNMASRPKRRVMIQFAGLENLSDSIVLPTGHVNLLTGGGLL